MQLKLWVNGLGRESKNCIRKFYKKKCSILGGVGSTLMVPIVANEHWTVAVLTPNNLLMFDSLCPPPSEAPTRLVLLKRLLAKLWAIHSGYKSSTAAWTRAMTKSTWPYINGPQQHSFWKCGFMAKNFIVEFYSGNLTEDEWCGNVRIRAHS